jgi:ribosomal protein S18 acetylase RimI-like enzyme
MDLDWQFKNPNLSFSNSESNVSEVIQHFNSLPQYFLNSLTKLIDLNDYVIKLCLKSERLEIWNGNRLVSLICYYRNFKENEIFISNVSTIPEHQGEGLAKTLMVYLLSKEENSIFKLELDTSNHVAARFYKSLGFQELEARNNRVVLTLSNHD